MPRHTTYTNTRTTQLPVPVATLATLRTDDEEPRFDYAPQVWDAPGRARLLLNQDLVTPQVRQPRVSVMRRVGGSWYYVAVPRNSLAAKQDRAKAARVSRLAQSILRSVRGGTY